MPILKGFPPSNTISPDVRINELDLSFIPAAQGTANCGLVGFASKGPINQATLIQTAAQLHQTFGHPHPSTSDPYMIYAGEQYLSIASTLWIVRCADTSPTSPTQATTASVTVPGAGGVVQIISQTAGPYVFSANQFFRFRLNGVLSPHILVVLAGTYTASQLATTMNQQLNSTVDGIQFFVASSGTIGVESTFSYGPNASIELVSTLNAMYGPSSVTGLGTLMTAASVTGTASKYPNNSYQTNGNYDFTGIANGFLNIVIDGTGNVNIDNVVQQVVFPSQLLTISQVVSTINNLITAATIPGGFVASPTSNNLTITTLHTGEDAKLLIKPDSTVASVFGLATTTNVGTSPTAVSGASPDTTYTAGIVTGSSSANATTTMTIQADSAGIEGNNTQVVVTNDTRSGSFSFSVFNNGSQVEAWGGLVKDQTSRFYAPTYLQIVSNYLRVVDVTSNPAPPAANTYSLSGGTDGIPTAAADQDKVLIGTSSGTVGFSSLSTGMQVFSDPEQTNIDIVACPGHSSTSIVDALISLCEDSRQDCLAIIDPPFGFSVLEVIAWQNGAHPLNTVQFNSSYAALYWPWLEIRDTFNAIDVFVPPSTGVIAAIANSDNISAPWFAPAGYVRGVVPNVITTAAQPTQAERDLMYGNSNAINPIIKFNDSADFLIWGQKTLQRTPTALDRVNVRRMMLYIEKSIRSASRQIIFEPNDKILRDRFIRLASNILTAVQQNRGLVDYFVQCDTQLNTPDVIDRNELRARIGVQPTKAAEFIFIQFSIYRTGAFSTTNTANNANTAAQTFATPTTTGTTGTAAGMGAFTNVGSLTI